MKKFKDFIEESASGRLMTMLKSKQLIKNPPKIPTPQERKAEQEKDKKPVSESDAAYGAALKAKEEKRKMSNISSSDKNKLMKVSDMMQKERDKKNMKKEETKPSMSFKQALAINKKDKDERETKRKAQDKESMASIKARIARAKAMKEAK